MCTDPIHVQMLGGLSLSQESTKIHLGTRSRKACLMLAYLILNRDRPVPYEELSNLIWENLQEPGTDRLNALKAVLHRTRNKLDELRPGFGREVILSRAGCFQWDPEVPIVLDVERFSALVHESGQAKDEDQRLELHLQALSLYQGEFLPVLADSVWVSVKANELHRVYLDTMMETLPMLAAVGRWQEIAKFSGEALAMEPCKEDLCRWRMESLIRLGLPNEAVSAYEKLHQQMMSKVGTLPAASLRELYRQACQGQEPWTVSPSAMMEQLHEPLGTGAMLCEYDFFRTICHSMVRAAERTGSAPHIALISLMSKGSSPLPWHSLDRAMGNLQEIIQMCLRRGDMFSRCSASQFILLLPGASFENTHMVCDRVTKAFVRQYPHSPAKLGIYIQPVLPGGGQEAP